MKTNHKLFAILAYGLVLFWLWQNGILFTPPKPDANQPGAGQAATTTGTQTAYTTTGTLPTQSIAAGTTQTLESRAAQVAALNQPGELIPVKTETYATTFSTRGAVPVRWDIIDERYALRQFDSQGNEIKSVRSEPIIDPAIAKDIDFPRPLEVTLKEEYAPGFYTEFNRCLYTLERSEGPEGAQVLKFTSQLAPNGVRLTKTYTLAKAGFVTGLELRLTNEGPSTMSFNDGAGGLGLLLGPGVGHPAANVSRIMFNVQKVDTMASGGEDYATLHVTEPGTPQEFPLPSMQWGAVQNLYFMMAAIDRPLEGQAPGFVRGRSIIDQRARKIAGVSGSDVAHYPTIELYRPPVTLQPGQSVAYGYDLYVGPKEAGPLKAAGHDLNRALFHDSWRWFRALCIGLMGLLAWFHHNVFANWGVAIILLTLTVKLVTFPLVHKGMKSQAKSTAEMMKIKPLIDEVNKKIKDPTKRQQEIMKLYREHGINPLGFMKGCFWLLIQLPIMAALYRVLYASTEVRGQGFLWVQDLAQPDALFHIGTLAFNLLPILVCITTFLTTKFTQQVATDPQQAQMQKTMLYVMPVIMLIFTYWFPAGLMVYWLVSNFWQVIQQLYVNKVIQKPQAAK